MAWARRVLQLVVLVAQGVVEDLLLLRASALTYYTVLALIPLLAIALSIAAALTATCVAQTVSLGALDLDKMRQGWGEPKVDESVTGKTLRIAGRSFARGVGTHAGSALHVALDGRVVRFRATVGVDDATEGKGTVKFRIYADGRKVFDSGVMKGGDAARSVSFSFVINGNSDTSPSRFKGCEK